MYGFQRGHENNDQNTKKIKIRGKKPVHGSAFGLPTFSERRSSDKEGPAPLKSWSTRGDSHARGIGHEEPPGRKKFVQDLGGTRMVKERRSKETHGDRAA